MNYSAEPLRGRLAGEYVLGTLHGRARRRFERLLFTEPALRAEVTAWEERLAPWLQRIAPVTPPARVWARIRRRLHGPSVTPWRWAAGLATAAALVLAVALVVLRPAPVVPSAPTHIAVFNARSGAPVWVIEAKLDAGRAGGAMHMQALAGARPPAGKSYELWMLPAEGAPVSLGLMPASGTADRRISAALAERLRAAQGLAVSLEPAGGSPSGRPTGPVVYSARLIRG